jgi:hypothetical protein
VGVSIFEAKYIDAVDADGSGAFSSIISAFIHIKNVHGVLTVSITSNGSLSQWSVFDIGICAVCIC